MQGGAPPQGPPQGPPSGEPASGASADGEDFLAGHPRYTQVCRRRRGGGRREDGPHSPGRSAAGAALATRELAVPLTVLATPLPRRSDTSTEEPTGG